MENWAIALLVFLGIIFVVAIVLIIIYFATRKTPPTPPLQEIRDVERSGDPELHDPSNPFPPSPFPPSPFPGPFPGPSPRVSLFQWNIHWQCFRNSCCSTVAIHYLNTNLVSRNVDFANFIELEDANYQPPSGYQKIIGHCGSGPITSGDVTTIVYNTRWTPVGSPQHFCINDPTGGSRGGSRPTLIQKFSLGSFTVYVAGIHFTHDRNSYVAGLKKAFETAGITASDNIIIMSDTNQHGSSAALITDILGVSPRNIQATPIHGTCCYNSHNPPGNFSLPYDRIIATFGSHMTSDFPTFSDVVPHPIAGCQYSEQHSPVFALVT